MKLKMYDDVRLNIELEELATKGIRKGCCGIIFEIKAGMCFVMFLNNLNRGDYACVNVNQKYLDYDGHNTEEQIKDFEKIKITRDLTKDSFRPQKFLEYDLVEITVEKEKYAKFGVHKGMQGVVMEEKCVDSCYYVIFTDEKTAEDIADISVHDEDLKLVLR